ncbi:MAG: outer membrane lipid asymmetry maintenance protein MlaD [Rhodospirillales bacterium]|nr:outer membrane lipid asymmetry maintenance protein MlaD [Rhodospirillales bacterium]
MPRRSIAEVLTGAVVLLVAAGFLVYAVAHSGRTTASGYTLHAQFDHIDGLGPGADVRIAGVKVGSVTATRLDPTTYLAVVDLSVRDDVKLPKDSSAEITSESLLGGKFLALVPGGDETMLKPGQMITITQGSVSLEQLLGKFIFSVTSLKPNSGDSGASGGNAPASSSAPASGSGAGSGGLPPLNASPQGQPK